MERGASDLFRFFQLRLKHNIQLKKEEFLYIAEFLLEGMLQLIDVGIYFQDLKPDNILVQFEEIYEYGQLKEINLQKMFIYLTDLGGCFWYKN